MTEKELADWIAVGERVGPSLRRPLIAWLHALADEPSAPEKRVLLLPSAPTDSRPDRPVRATGGRSGAKRGKG